MGPENRPGSLERQLLWCLSCAAPCCGWLSAGASCEWCGRVEDDEDGRRLAWPSCARSAMASMRWCKAQRVLQQQVAGERGERSQGSARPPQGRRRCGLRSPPHVQRIRSLSGELCTALPKLVSYVATSLEQLLRSRWPGEQAVAFCRSPSSSARRSSRPLAPAPHHLALAKPYTQVRISLVLPLSAPTARPSPASPSWRCRDRVGPSHAASRTTATRPGSSLVERYRRWDETAGAQCAAPPGPC